MSDRKRNRHTNKAGEASAPKRVAAPEFVNCGFYVDTTVSPLFDPSRVLLRRLFFLNDKKTRYVSVGYYPARDYEPLVEFGGPNVKPITIKMDTVTSMFSALAILMDAMCNKGSHSFRDGLFRMNTTINFDIAKMWYDKHSIPFRLQDLRQRSFIYYLVIKQLRVYTEALPDVLKYVEAALRSNDYVEPHAEASKNILYRQLFEELKHAV